MLSLVGKVIKNNKLKPEPKLTILDLKSETTVDGNNFKNVASMASKVSDNVVFLAEDGFYMIAEGDTENVRIDFSEG